MMSIPIGDRNKIWSNDAVLLSRPVWVNVLCEMEIVPIRHRICESVISGIRGMECVCAMVHYFLDMWLHSNPRPSTFTKPL